MNTENTRSRPNYAPARVGPPPERNETLMEASINSGIRLEEDAVNVELVRNTLAVVMHTQGNEEAIQRLAVLDPTILLKTNGGKNLPIKTAAEHLRGLLAYQRISEIMSAANHEASEKQTARFATAVANRIRKKILGIDIPYKG